MKTALIVSTNLGREDHGIMTFMLNIRTGSYGCMVGGYSLDEYQKSTKKRIFYPKSMEVISKILEVVGVDYWEELPGKYIRFEEGRAGIIEKIGNIIEEKWIDFPDFFEEE